MVAVGVQHLHMSIHKVNAPVQELPQRNPSHMTDDAPNATLTLAHLVNDLAQIVFRHVTVVLLAVKCVNKSNVWYNACRADAVSLSARSGTSAAFVRKTCHLYYSRNAPAAGFSERLIVCMHQGGGGEGIKITPFSVNLMRSQVLCWAAQACMHQSWRRWAFISYNSTAPMTVPRHGLFANTVTVS